MKNDDRQMIVVALFFMIVIMLVFVAQRCVANKPIEKGVTRITRAEAIRHLVAPKVKYRYRLPYYSKRIKAYRDELYRKKLVAAFEAAAAEFGLPVNLLLAIGYRETVMRTDQIGPKGELGIMQVMPFVVKRGKKYCSKVNTIAGGIMCGSWWLARGRDHCGDLEGAIGAYVSGRCNPTHPRAREAAANRLWIWRYLDGLTGEGGR